MKFTLPLICLCLTYCAFSTTIAQTNPNILVIVADDLGVDVSNGYQQNMLMPNTPNLDNLRSTGLTFKNVWAAPKCSPSRAAIISGKYGIKNGVLGTPGNLSTTHTSLFTELDTQTNGAYESALIGKWHLSPNDLNHPAQHGVDHYEGVFGAMVNNYYNWEKVTNGVVSTETEYVTTHLTNSAISWINSQAQPWFLWLAHVAPHQPFAVPPDSMYTTNQVNTNRQKFVASIEALDFDIGRLLDNIPTNVLNNTIIIFVSDNGSPSGVVQNFPGNHAKSTLYQGGIHVPMIVSGIGVTRQNEEEEALLHVTDVYATILELAGTTLPGGIHNSLSFDHMLTTAGGVSRPYNYSELEEGSASGWTIRDSQYKLIEFNTGVQEFYDLIADSIEATNLLDSLTPGQQVIKTEFEAEAAIIRNNWSCQDYIQNGTETGIDVCIPSVCTNDNSVSYTNIGCCDTPAFPNVYVETIIDDTRYLYTNNYPNHDYCYNPARIPEPVLHQFTFDATPSIAVMTTSVLNNNGRPDRHFGVAINGVYLSPAPAAPFIFENSNTGEFNWSWVFEPTNNQGNGPNLVGLDCASAHTNGQGNYHYHGNMFEFAEHIQPGISTTTTPPADPVQIGWASDGFPIVYRFGPNGTGSLDLLQPSYTLKSGDRPGDGISAPCGPYNGKYTNDYVYMPGAGDLDECNGINQVISLATPLGNETFDYFYVITDSFPQIPRCMVGTPDLSFDNNSNGTTAFISLNAKILLEGPFDAATGLMDDNLRSSGLIPLNEPYAALGYEAATGNEFIDPVILSITGNKAVIDWIHVELRHELDSTVLLFARSGLLLSDGSIVEVDGVTPLQFNYTPAGNYYVVIHHRNHLSIMTRDPITLQDVNVNSLDLSTTGTPVYGVTPRKLVGGVFFLLWSGDSTGDGAIDASDRSIAWNNRNSTGYFVYDTNLDGVCDAADRSIAWNNRNKVEQLP